MPKRSSGDEGVESTGGAAGAAAPGVGADAEAIVGGGVELRVGLEVGLEVGVGVEVGVGLGASLCRRAISRS
jgi:hypothetical protein